MSDWTTEWPTEVGTGRRWFYGWPYGKPDRAKPKMIAAEIIQIGDGSIMALARDHMRPGQAHGLWGPWIEEPAQPDPLELCHSGFHFYEITVKKWKPFGEPDEIKMFKRYGRSPEEMQKKDYEVLSGKFKQLDVGV